MHSAQRKTLEGEILLPMLPCWQLASGGNGSWDDYAFYIGCSPALCFFSVPCGKLRRPTNFHNIYWFWDAKTTSGYQQYVNVAHGGFSLPIWQEQTCESVSKIGRTKQLPKTVKTAWGYGTCMHFVSKDAMSNRVPLWYWLLLGPC